MDKVYVVTRGVKEPYYIATNDPEDYDETIYEDTLVDSEKVVGVFNDPSTAIQYMIEESNKRIKWMAENRQPYLTKEIYPWTIVEDQPVYYAVWFDGEEILGSEYLKYASYDVK